MGWKHCLVIVLSLFFIVLPHVAEAGGIRINSDSVETRGGREGVFAPGETVSITSRANIYRFGSDKHGYIIFVLHRRSNSGRASADDYRRGVIMAAEIGQDDGEGPLPIVVTFRAPNTPGNYVLSYSISPSFAVDEFVSSSITRGLPRPGRAFQLDDETAAVLQRSLSPSLMVEAASFAVATSTATTRPATPSVYLRVNGQAPSASPITGGNKEKPLRISWHIGSEYPNRNGNFEYRYKLYPSDKEWSAWSSTKHLDYAFLQRGFHDFRVQARHITGNGIIESREARLNFSLQEALVARVAKGPAAGTEEAGIINVSQLYPRSRALLIGMWEFDDRAAFTQFEGGKIRADISAMERALTANGFTDIQKLEAARLTKDDIEVALGEFITRATEGDRLIIYFSTHGFAHPSRPSEGYLATSNCDHQNASARCIPLSGLRAHAETVLSARRVKQILFAIDSCFSGLGVVSKSSISQAPNLARLAAPSGAYMLTAGMSDQTAAIDPVLGMSTFTHFLAKGLEGEADIIAGGVISLSELHLYVQSEVARWTKAKQIPMLGRIIGDGEMLFAPPKTPSPMPSAR
jgi:hypothetical protein